MRKRLRLLGLVVGALVLALVVSVQYVQFLNATGPPRPSLGIGDYLSAIAFSFVSVWTLATAASVAFLYRLIGSGLGKAPHAFTAAAPAYV